MPLFHSQKTGFGVFLLCFHAAICRRKPVRGLRPSLFLRELMGKLSQLALIAGPPARQTATRGLNAVIVHNWQQY